MADLNSILTAAQNIASAINGAAQAYLNVNGTANYPQISAATLVLNGRGRIAVVSITTAGSTNGTIYDANDATATTLPIYTIPNTIGVVVLNFPVTNGIVIVPGTSQVLSVSYSKVTA